MPRRINYHYHRPGKPETVFEEWLVIDRTDVKVLLLERYGGKPLHVADAVVQECGAPIIWFVFPGAWHDVGRFHLASGTFTGWYTNLTQPVSLQDPARWSCTDMFLDLWTPVHGASRWLDEDEFAEAVRSRLIDGGTESRVRAERASIEASERAGAWPPDICRNVALPDVLARLKQP